MNLGESVSASSGSVQGGREGNTFLISATSRGILAVVQWADVERVLLGEEEVENQRSVLARGGFCEELFLCAGHFRGAGGSVAEKLEVWLVRGSSHRYVDVAVEK